MGSKPLLWKKPDKEYEPTTRARMLRPKACHSHYQLHVQFPGRRQNPFPKRRAEFIQVGVTDKSVAVHQEKIPLHA